MKKPSPRIANKRDRLARSSTRTSDKPAGRTCTTKQSAKPTKAEAILKLLTSKEGASIGDMQKATGWQAHSVRGFLSGTVKKRMGLGIATEPDKDGVRRYRVGEPAGAPAGQ